MISRRRLLALAIVSSVLLGCGAPPPIADRKQALESLRDVWANQALAQPGGPTYAFFENLLPPLRYVDASFRHYPIVLSAPGATTKARLISNGSCINALARQPNWKGETGTPVTFLVGDRRDVFGSDLSTLTGPKYAEGYLPIVQLSYASDGATYAQEAFAPADPALAKAGAVLVKLTLTKASGRNYNTKAAKDQDPASTAPVAGVEAAENLAVASKDFDEKIEALIDGPGAYTYKENRILNSDGHVIALTHPRWIFNPGRGALIAPLKTGESTYLAIFTKPLDASAVNFSLDADSYESQRTACATRWNELLAGGMTVDTPEAIVNDAARASIIGNFMLLHGDEMRYSAGNQYAKLYIGEGGDTIRAMTLWGYASAAKRMMPPQFNYTRAGLEFHQAAFKLQMLAHYFRLTRDLQTVRALAPMWQKEIDVIVKGRQTDNGMFPREKYCGDIDTRVFSLNSNANCWRALRDMSDVVAATGDTEQAQKLLTIVNQWRTVLLEAIENATNRDVDPPFVPIALSGEEQPHDPIWGTTIGSYWNLMIEYVLSSGVFTPESQTTTDILKYLQQRGGLCMGILRAREGKGNFWVAGGRLNDLYGMRYALMMARRDQPDRALVSFYGKLAQGMTRDTFIGCEGSSMNAVDVFGRQMYLPPNSAANANFLQQLRYLLVQDYDLDDDGRAETLRLCFATPRAWLADGKQIKVTDAPTEFGPVSFTVESKLSKGVVEVDLDLPERNRPEKTLIRLRLPGGAKVIGAKDGETIDISQLKGHAGVTVKIRR